MIEKFAFGRPLSTGNVTEIKKNKSSREEESQTDRVEKEGKAKEKAKLPFVLVQPAREEKS